MKFTSRFLLGLTAVAMVACSNDEPFGGPDNGEMPNGEVAYMTIKISSADEMSRSTENGGFVDSDYDDDDLQNLEHKVETIKFLFFDDKGGYMFDANANDATSVTPVEGSTGNNVEYFGSTNIVVLDKVNLKDTPTYLITVINAPADFTPGATLQETSEKLAVYATDFSSDRTAPFVMSTSSFLGDKNGLNGAARHDGKYYATKLNENDFKTTLAEAQNNTQPVEIYVERLAAKVQLTVAPTDATRYTKIGNDYYFKVEQTLGGGNNQTDGDNVSNDALYIKVVGWGLNAIAQKSYISKQLDTNWADNNPFTAWNNAENWRSFWAKAWTYGNEMTADYLTYITPAQLTKTIDGYAYCYENTNTPGKIFDKVDENIETGRFTLDSKMVAVNNAKVTHMVLHTQIYQQVNGTMQNVQLVQYRGVLFKEDSFRALLLNSLKANNKLNFWLPDGDEKNADGTFKNWKTIDTSALTIAQDKSDGHVLGEIMVTVNNGLTVYKKGDDGKYTVNANYATELNKLIAEMLASNPAVGSDTDGDAIYYIPIEHLAATANQTEAVEAYYGVVRNHWYRLNIQSFKKVGHLVYDPEHDTTPIIPEGPEDPFYYVGANIKILSWKVVNQNVSDL